MLSRYTRQQIENWEKNAAQNAQEANEEIPKDRQFNHIYMGSPQRKISLRDAEKLKRLEDEDVHSDPAFKDLRSKLSRIVQVSLLPDDTVSIFGSSSRPLGG